MMFNFACILGLIAVACVICATAQKPTRSPTRAPTRSPTLPPTKAPVPSPTKAPTASPSYTSVRNATIKNGFLVSTDNIQSIQPTFLGNTSSAIQNFISSFFPKPNFVTVTDNTANYVWYNSSRSLSYLTIIGQYRADIPIKLQSQLIIVLDGAVFDTTPDFAPVKNQSLTKTRYGVFVADNVHFTGIVSPKGPKQAIINCSGTFNVTAAGILMYNSYNFYVDGVTVDNCGENSGNFVLYGIARAELSNSVSLRARTRGIWLVIMNYIVLHDNFVSDSRKFGVDADAMAGNFILYRNKIQKSGYQGFFLEQGAQISLSTQNDFGPLNSNGVAVFNYEFSRICADHLVINNKIDGNRREGIKVGSTKLAVGHELGANNYFIANNVGANWADPGKTTATYNYFGIEANGPVYGTQFISNNVTGPIGIIALKTGNIFYDPLKRLKNVIGAPTSRPTHSPVPPPSLTPTSSDTISINATISNSVLSFTSGLIEPSRTVGNKCSVINKVISKYFSNLKPMSHWIVQWAWKPLVPQILSFLTLEGDFVCDEPLRMTAQLVLVLNGATITAVSEFPLISKGLIVASNANFASVVSPGGLRTAIISCNGITGPAGIYSYNSTQFTVDGVTVSKCGGKNLGAITIEGSHDGTSIKKWMNSSAVLNSDIVDSQSSGILLSGLVRPSIIKNIIRNSKDGAGVSVQVNTYGAIISMNTIDANSGEGVLISTGSNTATVNDNMISNNMRTGISLANVNGFKSSSSNSIIANNIIVKNNLNSILLASYSNMSALSFTMIAGNTIKNNKIGIGMTDGFGKVTNTYMANNDNADGFDSSFFEGRKKTVFLDPLNRGGSSFAILAPLPAPTAAPSYSSSTRIIFNCSQEVSGVPKSSFDDDGSKKAVSGGVGSTLGGTNTNQVQFVDAKQVQTSSSFMLHLMSTPYPKLELITLIEIKIEEMGFTDPKKAFSAISMTMARNLAKKSLLERIQEMAVVYNVSTILDGLHIDPFKSITLGEVKVLVDYTSAPSPAPSLSPSTTTSGSSNEPEDDLLAVKVAVPVVGSVLLFVAIYYAFNHRAIEPKSYDAVKAVAASDISAELAEISDAADDHNHDLSATSVAAGSTL